MPAFVEIHHGLACKNPTFCTQTRDSSARRLNAAIASSSTSVRTAESDAFGAGSISEAVAELRLRCENHAQRLTDFIADTACSITLFIWQHPSNTSPRVINVIVSAWDKVNMTVKHCLSGASASIHPHVEALDASVFFE